MTLPRLPQPRLRALVGEALRGDADLDAFCADHFPDVYRRFSDGMQRVRKVTLLLDHADPGRLTELLLGLTSGGGASPALDPQAPAAAGGRIKVLFLGANPRSTTQLGLGREVRQIEDKLRAAAHRDAVTFTSRWAARPDDLQQALLEERPHVLHFSGHGTQGDRLAFEDEAGEIAFVDKGALADLIAILKDNLQVVVLNACSSEPLAEALTQHVACAVGMHQPIGDLAATEFAASFYRALGFGRTVDEAFRLGCSALRLHQIPEHQIPRLKVKAGVDAASLRLVAPA
ncbi:CHAT domain-containing protein [Sorangium cellulosum]|uniref:CHAT domain-containing protein n=1 Tax=Sorangium cellulosum TaxID=56 RepID=UPI0013313C78|nr:CHAT domain-containing protein [Sorangium cellulosum]